MSNDKSAPPKPLFDKPPPPQQSPTQRFQEAVSVVRSAADAAQSVSTKPKVPRTPRPLFGPKGTANLERAHRPPNAVFDAKVQTIIDDHLKAIMGELEAAGVKPVGVVAGVLHDGETSVNWCVSDDVHDDEGKPLTADEVAREIAADIERSTAGE